MTLRKIISSGRGGVGQAALTAAVDLGLLHGGWKPRGFLGGGSPEAPGFRLTEIASGGEKAAALQNLIDGEALLLVSRGPLDDLCRFLRRLARGQDRICRHIDLTGTPLDAAGQEIAAWLRTHKIRILTVYGSTQMADPVIADLTRKVIAKAYYLSFRDLSLPGVALASARSDRAIAPPVTVAAAISHLVEMLPLRDKVAIARMPPEERVRLNSTLGRFIRNRFKLWIGNPELLSDCRRLAGRSDLKPHQAPEVIIAQLCETLRRSHLLTRIK
jgi:hypothetical protein